jgi:site-specific DNA-methyltransferase (adenine-specific)
VTDPFVYGQAKLINCDCLEWLNSSAERSIHAIVTDPPYGFVEYAGKNKAKLRSGRGGVWRIPPSFDGHRRSPLPRFTVLTKNDLRYLSDFFDEWGKALRPRLVPGAHVLIASNPLVSPLVSHALAGTGLERRGEIVRLVMTMRGGDRPKNAHEEFGDVSVMPRSQWEPWLLFREPIEGRTVAENLRKWKTGGLRRISDSQPFGDVIRSHRTTKIERKIASHPSLKPQSFLRRVARAMLPLGEGTILDPFAGSGSTLAAAQAIGYDSIGLELDPMYSEIATTAIPALAKLQVREDTADLDE